MAWFWVNLKQALASSKGSCKLLRFCDIKNIHRASILTLCIKEELALAYSWSRLCVFSLIVFINGIKVLENTVGKNCTKSILLPIKVNWKLFKAGLFSTKFELTKLSEIVRTFISVWWQWAYELHWIWWFRKFVIWTLRNFW